MSEKPTFEATFPDGEIKGTLKIGNETISVYLKEIAEEDRFTIMDSPLRKRTITKRKFILIEERHEQRQRIYRSTAGRVGKGKDTVKSGT